MLNYVNIDCKHKQDNLGGSAIILSDELTQFVTFHN
jgi:hypothetical protein